MKRWFFIALLALPLLASAGILDLGNGGGGGVGAGDVTAAGDNDFTGENTFEDTTTFGSATSTTFGDNPYVVINSSGSSASLTLNVNGEPSGGAQNQSGALNIKSLTAAGPPATLLVIVDSTTDTQDGLGLFEIWELNENHNDPLIWLHNVGQDSAPFMRIDDDAPDFEIVNTSTANATGKGKWEMFASAYQSARLQIGNSRNNDNSSFQGTMYMEPMQQLDYGLYMNVQDLDGNSAVLTTSDTFRLAFGTQNGRYVGLTGPLNASASWTFGLPSTFNNPGQVLYQADNGRGNNLNARQWEFTTGGSPGFPLHFTSTFTAPSWQPGGSVNPVTAFTAATFTMLSTHTVVTSEASSTASSTGTLPSAGSTPTGQMIEITKVDTSTHSVRIVAASGDTIVGVSTISLQAYGSTVRLVAKAANTWFPDNFQGTPSWYGDNGDVASAATGVASTTYHQEIYVEAPCDTKSITYQVGTDSGLVYFAVYNQYGQVMVSSSAFASGGTGTITKLIPKANLQPGRYYMAFGADNATITFTRYASNMLTAGMYSKALNIPLAANIGNPPIFDNASARAPAVILRCHGSPP